MLAMRLKIKVTKNTNEGVQHGISGKTVLDKTVLDKTV
jgi:hypothetical protein